MNITYGRTRLVNMIKQCCLSTFGRYMPLVLWAFKIAIFWVCLAVCTLLACLTTSSYTVEVTGAATNHTLNLSSKMDALLPIVHHDVSDHIYFNTYDGSNLYDNKGSNRGTIKRRPYGTELKIFDQVRDEAILYLKQRGNCTYHRHDCNDIRYRVVPTVGVELDVICTNSYPPSGTAERVTLLQPFQPSRVLFHSHIDTTQVINIIMPLMGRPEAFQLFVDNLRGLLKNGGGGLQLGLTVFYYNDRHTHSIRQILSSTQDIVGLQTQFILHKNQNFSRAKALTEGVKKSHIKAEVMFLCDVDVLFTKSFLRRCLANAVQGSQVYFPTYFSQYNPQLIYPLQGQKVPSPLDTLTVRDDHGYWRVWGHGMVCIYKSDFFRINGFDESRTGWGGEDLIFLKKTASKKYKIIRSLDYGLIHHYHPKNCEDAGRGQKSSCMRVKARSEASIYNVLCCYR
ncbi:chondroitin sulfate N-acetylgalactosaminyltransferase 2-like isoform X2 [Homarus americanus]|uniref:chondroitin sulfate N-acetylgalactosaminyltransferase 2-like isoform X2 n=1 Tax=Homarus americanus TaxID=6706 RepID=UPI001C47F0AA|nr:chondroitin sulfate N-acetylgalactosaminyltransferase 2-like isoform X2 [Homarus americanus]